MAISDGMTVGWTSPMIPYFLSENSHISMTRHQAEWLETWYPHWINDRITVYRIFR